jgi:hypothetical protein
VVPLARANRAGSAPPGEAISSRHDAGCGRQTTTPALAFAFPGVLVRIPMRALPRLRSSGEFQADWLPPALITGSRRNEHPVGVGGRRGLRAALNTIGEGDGNTCLTTALLQHVRPVLHAAWIAGPLR